MAQVGDFEEQWDQIQSQRLHGCDLTPPDGFQRGIEVLGENFQSDLQRACRVYQKFHKKKLNLINPSTFTEKQVLF